MTHRFPIKEIALQSGLSTATVDRALNKRRHVSPQTATRVAAAIAELEGQEAQLAARGRRMFFDVIVEAPTRFSKEVHKAAEQAARNAGPAVCRVRFMAQEIMTEAQVLAALARIAKRGSHGVCLKARDTAAIRNAVDRLTKAGIPVVTLATDLPTSQRVTYVGLDNQSAGRTAAYLVSTALAGTSGTVLALRSNDRFWGEEEREIAFLQSLSTLCPDLDVIQVSGGSGVHHETSQVLDGVIEQLTNLRAVYSMGGGNRTILDILHNNRLQPKMYIAHDLDADNRDLIAQGQLNFVLHHDLMADLATVFHAFLHHHKLMPNPPLQTMSNVQIVTPENIPAKL